MKLRSIAILIIALGVVSTCLVLSKNLNAQNGHEKHNHTENESNQHHSHVNSENTEHHHPNEASHDHNEEDRDNPDVTYSFPEYFVLRDSFYENFACVSSPHNE